MVIIKNYTEYWDDHSVIKIIIMDDNTYDIIGGCNISLEDKYTKLESVYIQPKYRGEGYFKIIMDEAFKLYNDSDTEWALTLMVRKDNFIKEKYYDYGFRFLEDNEDDKKYEWLIYND